MHSHAGTWNVAVGSPNDPADLIFTSEHRTAVIVTIRKRHDSALPIVVQLNGELALNGALSMTDTARTFVLADVTTLHVAAGPTPSGVPASANGDYTITLLEDLNEPGF
jgi:hypothetical protein